jgi:hypothetical protein
LGRGLEYNFEEEIMMPNKKEQFIEILKIELEDLKKDIELLISEAEKARVVERISNYVFLENLAIFRDEIVAVDALASFLHQSCADGCLDVEELRDKLLKLMNDKIFELRMPSLMMEWVDRKVDKAYRFLIRK